MLRLWMQQLAILFIALILEYTYRLVRPIAETPMRFLFVLAAIGMLFGSSYVLQTHPEQYTALANFFVGVVLTGFSIGATYHSAYASAKQTANSKWIPQAEQSCRSLLTAWHDVLAYQRELTNICGVVARELPEMQDPKLLAARVAINFQCQGGARRLESIGRHLTNAVSAWESFITENCTGVECIRVNGGLQEYRDELETDLASATDSPPCETMMAQAQTAA